MRCDDEDHRTIVQRPDSNLNKWSRWVDDFIRPFLKLLSAARHQILVTIMINGRGDGCVMIGHAIAYDRLPCVGSFALVKRSDRGSSGGASPSDRRRAGARSSRHAQLFLNEALQEHHHHHHDVGELQTERGKTSSGVGEGVFRFSRLEMWTFQSEVSRVVLGGKGGATTRSGVSATAVGSKIESVAVCRAWSGGGSRGGMD
nr:hypothetical protein CFP56_68762 [Quercus suber]